MKPSYLLAPLLLLLASCGVSSSDQRKMEDDLRSKVAAIYLHPDAPGMVESFSLSEIEKGEAYGHGDFHMNFSMIVVSDSGRAHVSATACFDKNGQLVFVDSTHVAVYPFLLSESKGGRLPYERWSEYLPSQFKY